MPLPTSSTTRLAALSPNTLGSLYMVVGSLGYVTNDALIREATEEGLDVYQALCLRGFAMSVLFAAAIGTRKVAISRRRVTRPLVVRVGAELVATALFFAAIVRLDFAHAQTILLIVPFAITLAAAVVLGESVGARRYATVGVGFLGVLLVVRPATDGFSYWSLAVVASAACLTVREFATRRIDDDIPASLVALITAVSITLMTGGLAIFTGWNAVTAKAWVLVIPGALTILGCTVIALSGLYSIHLERRATLRFEM